VHLSVDVQRRHLSAVVIAPVNKLGNEKLRIVVAGTPLNVMGAFSFQQPHHHHHHHRRHFQ